MLPVVVKMSFDSVDQAFFQSNAIVESAEQYDPLIQIFVVLLDFELLKTQEDIHEPSTDEGENDHTCHHDEGPEELFLRRFWSNIAKTNSRERGEPKIPQHDCALPSMMVVKSVTRMLKVIVWVRIKCMQTIVNVGFIV